MNFLPQTYIHVFFKENSIGSILNSLWWKDTGRRHPSPDGSYYNHTHCFEWTQRLGPGPPSDTSPASPSFMNGVINSHSWVDRTVSPRPPLEMKRGEFCVTNLRIFTVGFPDKWQEHTRVLPGGAGWQRQSTPGTNQVRHREKLL